MLKFGIDTTTWPKNYAQVSSHSIVIMEEICIQFGHYCSKFFSSKVRLMYQSLTKKFRDVDGVLKDPGCRAESILQVYDSTIYNQGMIRQVLRQETI